MTQKQRGRKPLKTEDKKHPVTLFVKFATIAKHGGINKLKIKLNEFINETTTI